MHMEWLQAQRIETIVDFEPWVTTKYQISTDNDYLQMNAGNEIRYYKKKKLDMGSRYMRKLKEK